jgi:hypothetical protein
VAIFKHRDQFLVRIHSVPNKKTTFETRQFRMWRTVRLKMICSDLP